MNKETIYQKEEIFHDDWARGQGLEKILVDEFFEAETAPENRFILKELGVLNGKKILDIGCGLGESSVYFAKKGAIVTATDISEEMLKFAERLANKHQVHIMTRKSNAEYLDFPDNSFDFVYAANLLHHVDINTTLKEIHRVLNKGGVLASWDPLAHNPAINVYRRMAKNVRTDDEHPIKMSELNIFNQYFSDVKFETRWLFTLMIFIKFYFIDRINPNKERYWKKIIFENKKLESSYLILEKIDKYILKAFPFLKRYCWNIIVIARK
jgi:ubiquinone/menaquinone biosynthesis C-methylase UbiE